MIISAVERIINKEKSYQEFCYWVESQDDKIKEELSRFERFSEQDFKKIVRVLREDYFQSFGSRRNVFDFFQQHLSVENKIKLVKSIRANWIDVIPKFYAKSYELARSPIPNTIEELSEESGLTIEKQMTPYCYDWKRCYVEYGKCIPGLACPLKDDRSLRKKVLKKVVNDIYQIRSDFVHEAKITPLNEADAIGTLSAIGARRKLITIELTSEELEDIFEEALKHYFDDLVNRSRQGGEAD